MLENVAFFQGIIAGCKTCSVSSGGWVYTCNKTWKLKGYMGKDSLAYVISVLSPRKFLVVINYSILPVVKGVEICSTAANAIFLIFVFK